MKIVPLLTGILCIALTAGLARGQGLPFKNFSIQSGMSQSVINDVIQDHEGYVWIATEIGLNRFNRYQFEQYFEADGLSNNGVTSLLQLRDRTILIGTERGLDYIRPDGRFEPLPGTQILRGTKVNVLFEDQSGGLWVGTENEGLHHFRSDTYQYYSTANGLADNEVRDIIRLDEERLAVATRGGISVLSITDRSVIQSYYEADGLSENRTRSLVRMSDGSIWAATRDGITILKDGELSYLNVADGLIHPRVTRLMEDGKGGVWIGTEGGLSHYYEGRISNFTDANGLSNNIITSLMRDRENNIWIGTYGGGLDLLVSEKIQHYSVQQGLLSNLTTSFMEDRSGRMMIGTYGGGIAVIDGFRVRNITTADNLIDNRVYTMMRDREDRVWIGTRNGVSLMENGRIYPGNQFPDLPDPKVRSILEDSKGDFWVATYGGGLARYTAGRQVAVLDTSNNRLPNNIVMDVLEDRNGVLWAATYGGVVRIDGERTEVFNTDNGLANNNAMTLFEDSLGQIWIGTFDGISIYFGGQLRTLNSSNGLPQPVAYFITEDERGFIWIGSNNGLLRYNPQILQEDTDPARVRDMIRFKQYTTESGLISNENIANAVYTARDGSFWMGTVTGANHFRWRLDLEITSGPPVHIEEMTLFGERLPAGAYEFRHDENFIGFNFTGLAFANPSELVYEYRLRGADQQWQRTTQRSVRYTTLPDGEYRFEVRARNSDGYWSPQPDVISFVILPPFWKTWWFAVLIVFAVLLVAAFLYNYYRISRMVDLERIRIRIASDLHDDVGASLTEIALQSDFLQAIQKDPKTGESLKQIGEMSRRIVTTMDDIVWSIDARNDSYGDLLDRMQDYATNVLSPKGIEPVFHFRGIDSQAVVPLELRQNLYLIFKESLNNAAKHAEATTVEVTLSMDASAYTLQIKDNGKGLPEKTRPGGHGLKNIALRASRIHAALEYKNENGLTITITGKK